MDWSVCLLFNKTHDKVLLQANQRGKWIAIKAHVQKGAKPIEAAIARINGLMHMDIKAVDVLPITSTSLLSVYTTFHTYAACVEEQEPEQHYLRWFSVQDILEEGVSSNWLDGDGAIQYNVMMSLKRLAGAVE